MKALHIMLFLLLFNLSVSIVSGLNIYNMGVSVPDEFREGDIESYEGTTARRNILSEFLVMSFSALVAGIVAGSVISYLTRIPADRAYVYSIFFSTYWAMAWASTSTIWNIGSENLGVQMVVIVFSIILVVLFMAAVMQMPVGGWKAYE